MGRTEERKWKSVKEEGTEIKLRYKIEINTWLPSSQVQLKQ